mgnify:CR=1 FL=1
MRDCPKKSYFIDISNYYFFICPYDIFYHIGCIKKRGVFAPFFCITACHIPPRKQARTTHFRIFRPEPLPQYG